MSGRRRWTQSTAMGAGRTSRSRVVLALQRLALRTARWPGWAAVYRGLARAVTAYVTRGDRRASRYVKGGVTSGDLVPAVSDVDTVVVLPDGGAAGVARSRGKRLARTAPLVALLVDRPFVYEETELPELGRASALTVGLDGAGSAYFGRGANFDRLRTLERPGLYGLADGWRRLGGLDRRPPGLAPDPQRRRVAAWLELAHVWRWAYPLALDATGPRSAAMCVKLVAEPVRIWLWLARGERSGGRGEVLRRGLRELPEEEAALRRAHELHRSLTGSPPAPFAELLPAAVRISARIGAEIEAQLEGEGTTRVRLVGEEPLVAGASPGSPVLPLADFRALVCPLVPDEGFAPRPGDPADATVLAATARDSADGPYPSLRAGGVAFRPAIPWWRTRLRAVQCPPTDPVSFALEAGRATAGFPAVAGWSARDVARRAVAEHLAWLAGEPPSRVVRAWSRGSGPTLGRLLTAARAALFLRSIEDGDPELALTVAAAARGLARRSPGVAEEALASYRVFARAGTPPAAATVAALREVVLSLPAYDSIRSTTRPTTAPRSSIV